MSFAAEPSGGTPIAGFDLDELVQRLWSERTGIGCWGGFGSVRDAAHAGLLDELRSAILIYISGSPCPDFSSAGARRGLDGTTGNLWLDDCDLGIRLGPPVIIREMVTGIFDVDGGSPFWAAVDRYRDAGYAVSWAVRRRGPRAVWMLGVGGRVCSLRSFATRWTGSTCVWNKYIIT